MSTEDRLAHCRMPTGTQSMCFNSGSQRVNSTRLMNFTSRKVSAVTVKTNSVRLSFTSNTGVVQDINNNNPAGINWVNIFKEAGAGGVEAEWSTFSPTLVPEWRRGGATMTETVKPTYIGEDTVCSLYGYVVLRLNNNQTDGLFNLGIFINGKLIGATPTEDSLDSPFMTIARPDITSTADQMTSSLTVNLVAPIQKDDYVELKMRYIKQGGAPSDTISCMFYQANLFLRPIDLTGIDKTT